MAEIRVARKFKLRTNDGQEHTFDQGVHEVTDEIAEHWYTRAHLHGAKAEQPGLGTPEYTRTVRAAVERRRELYEEGLEVLREAEEAEAAQEAARQAALMPQTAENSDPQVKPRRKPAGGN